MLESRLDNLARDRNCCWEFQTSSFVLVKFGCCLTRVIESRELATTSVRYRVGFTPNQTSRSLLGIVL
jgi:hypothetical protein